MTEYKYFICVYLFTGLTPFTNYEFQVQAVNNIGQGLPSESVYVKTGETGNFPQDLAIFGLFSGLIVVTLLFFL